MNWLTGLIVKLFVGRLESFLGHQPALADDPTVIANTCDSYGAQAMASAIYADLAHTLYSLINRSETLTSALCHLIVLLAALAIIWTRHAASRNEAKLQYLVDQLAAKTTIKIDLGTDVNRQAAKTPSPSQNFSPLLLLGVLGALAVTGCAAPGSAHLSRQTVTGLHAEIPSTTGSGSLLKISFGRIQNTYIDIPTNSAPFSSTYQADASGKSPIFGNASTSTRDSVGYGESAVTTSTGGGLIVGSETGGVQRVVVPNLAK